MFSTTCIKKILEWFNAFILHDPYIHDPKFARCTLGTFSLFYKFSYWCIKCSGLETRIFEMRMYFPQVMSTITPLYSTNIPHLRACYADTRNGRCSRQYHKLVVWYTVLRWENPYSPTLETNSLFITQVWLKLKPLSRLSLCT